MNSFHTAVALALRPLCRLNATRGIASLVHNGGSECGGFVHEADDTCLTFKGEAGIGGSLEYEVKVRVRVRGGVMVKISLEPHVVRLTSWGGRHRSSPAV
jgi:hypothetical protein